MKVVVNRCYGGFGIGDDAFAEYLTRMGVTFYRWGGKFSSFGDTFTTVPKEEYTKLDAEKDERGWFNFTPEEKQKFNNMYLSYHSLERNDPVLIDIVEEWGERAWGRHAELEVVEIPDDVDFTIEEYDGKEWIAEVHRTW